MLPTPTHAACRETHIYMPVPHRMVSTRSNCSEEITNVGYDTEFARLFTHTLQSSPDVASGNGAFSEVRNIQRNHFAYADGASSFFVASSYQFFLSHYLPEVEPIPVEQSKMKGFDAGVVAHMSFAIDVQRGSITSVILISDRCQLSIGVSSRRESQPTYKIQALLRSP